MEPIFTPQEKEAAKRRDVTVFTEMVEETFFAERNLPTDVHRVEYRIGTETFIDAVRAYKKVDIFDLYYDKLSTMDGAIVDIKSGYGTVKPKLFNIQTTAA